MGYITFITNNMIFGVCLKTGHALQKWPLNRENDDKPTHLLGRCPIVRQTHRKVFWDKRVICPEMNATCFVRHPTGSHFSSTCDRVVRWYWQPGKTWAWAQRQASWSRSFHRFSAVFGWKLMRLHCKNSTGFWKFCLLVTPKKDGTKIVMD